MDNDFSRYNDHGGQNENKTQYQYTYYQNLFNGTASLNPQLNSCAKELRILGLLCGAAFIGFYFMQYVVSFALSFFGLSQLYRTDIMFRTGFGTIAPFFYILVPFLIIFIFFKEGQKNSTLSSFEAPKSPAMFIFAVFSGLMICTAGDFASGLFSMLANVGGMEFSSPQQTVPDSLSGAILFVISTAAVPALVEEFAFRGIVLQPLRKFGDKFAIVISALFFALLHGNMIQIVFAFIAGLALGYFAVATESIWTSISIHFLNNLWSALYTVYYMRHPENSELVLYTVYAGIAVIGIFALVLFIKNKPEKLKKDSSEWKRAVKPSTFLCTPTSVLSVMISFNTALQSTSITSGIGAVIVIAVLITLFVLVLRGRAVLYNDRTIKFSSMYTVSCVVIGICAILTMLITLSSTLYLE